jgi:hypothetical protein
MRKIKWHQILAFLAFFAVALTLAICSTAVALGGLPLGDFRGIALVAAALAFLYLYAVLLYRGFLALCPLKPGEVVEGSGQEFVYHVYVLFYLLLFYPIMRSGFVPAPFMRWFYLALGAKLGENTYSQGIIHDPPFVEVGAHSVIGQSALLIPHIIEGGRLAHYPIRIGNHVTIGAHAVVLSGVTIGDHAIVATGAVVSKGTQIAGGEIWGGVPARALKEN